MNYLILALLFLAVPVLAQEQKPNHLLGQDSPYLLQHLYNPVDWYPWGPEALEKARNEDKLIFLSVGYSACHWCHVMEEESFRDEEIAAFLNKYFVSIKVDRERRPDLDEQFMLATQTLTGAGGWPNSVFMTPEGGPFFAGTYFPPVPFLDVLTQVVALRESDPELIEAEGERLKQLLSRYLTFRAEALELTPEMINDAARSVLPELDFFSGGLGVTAKFPTEPLFLFLLDQAQRTGDAELLEGVTTMLDAMIIGGIHDQVGGGFHRYAVDPGWHVPHFEKMLYTQALTGRLLVRGWQATGKASYRRAAERLFDYVLREMQDAGGGFYAAQDADSDNAAGEYVEGAFYTWTPAQLAQMGADSEFLADVFQVTENGEFDGSNVLNLPDLAEVMAQGLGLDEAGFYAQLDPLLERMRALRAQRAAPLTDRKIVVGWNAVMIATLAEAAQAFERPDYLQSAAQAADFIMENMVLDGGLSRVSFEGKSTVAGQLADYAGLGLALVALQDYSPDPAQKARRLQQAGAMANEIRARFGNPENAFRMTETVDGISAMIPVEDGEIASGNALALDLFARLIKRRQNPELALDTARLAAALSGYGMDIPSQRATILRASQDLEYGETGPVRYIAGGAVRIEQKLNRAANTVRFTLEVAEGWHINAHVPLEDFYIPMGLTMAGQPVAADAYPVAVVKSLGFNPKPLALYEGVFSVEVPVSAGAAIMTLQACNDEICLQPEELRFQLW